MRAARLKADRVDSASNGDDIDHLQERDRLTARTSRGCRPGRRSTVTRRGATARWTSTCGACRSPRGGAWVRACDRRRHRHRYGHPPLLSSGRPQCSATPARTAIGKFAWSLMRSCQPEYCRHSHGGRGRGPRRSPIPRALGGWRRRFVVREPRAITFGGGAVGPRVRSVRRSGFSCSSASRVGCLV